MAGGPSCVHVSKDSRARAPDTSSFSSTSTTTGDRFGVALVEDALKDPKLFLERYDEGSFAGFGRRRIEVMRAIGVAHRELRDLDLSATVLTAAAAEAESLGDPQLTALVRLSLAATQLYQGDANGAVTTIDDVLEHLDGDDRFLALGQRAGILHRAGRLDEALDAFDSAFADPLASQPTSALAELHNNRGVLRGYLDRYDDAEADINAARRLFMANKLDKRGVDMLHNLAWLAGRRGDLARSLQLFDEAGDGYAALNLPADTVLPDRCEVLIAAGLLHEALAVADTACAAFKHRGDKADLAEALVMTAQIALRVGLPVRAMEAAEEATTLLDQSGRAGWRGLAEVLRIAAAIDGGAPPPGALDRLHDLREELQVGGLAAARHDLDLLRTRLLIADGAVGAASLTLRRVPMAALSLPSRALARALRAQIHLARGDQTRARRELARALDDLDSVRSALTSSELRVSIGFHADDVIRLGQRLLLREGRPADVLRWCERGRARSLRYTSVIRQARADELDAELGRLRLLEQQLAETPPGTSGFHHRQAEVRRSMAHVRSLSRHGAETPSGRQTLPLARIRAVLADAHLIQLIDDGEQLHAATLTRRTTTLHHLGPTAEIDHLARTLRQAVARVITGRGDQRLRAASSELLHIAANRVDAVLSSVIPPSPRPVVIIPTPRLHATPWGALPSLKDRAFVVAPSITAWTSASSRRGPDLNGSTLTVAGPRLVLGADEVRAISPPAPTGIVLQGADATALNVLSELHHAEFAHLACHGRFVAENPLLSSLEVTDGPMYLYELEHHQRLPPVMVLSACSSGMTADRPGDELMGFVATLLASGCRSVIASTVALPDTQATVDAMVELHVNLRSGVRPAVALRTVRVQHPVIGACLNVFGGGL